MNMSADLFINYPLSESSELVAEGAYRYSCDGHVFGVKEPWYVHRCDGNLQIRSERWLPDSGLRIQVFGELVSEGARQGLCDKFEVRWQEGEDKGFNCVANYQLSGDQLRTRRHDSLTEAAIATQVINLDAVAFPLLRIFLGPTVLHLLKQGGEGQYIVPCITDPNQINELLIPLLSQRQAQHLNTEDLIVDGVCWPDVRCCDYRGEQYQAGSKFWFSREGILLKYSWQQDDKTWDVQLQNFSGNKDFFNIEFIV